VMLYWLPATGASSARMYWESFERSFTEGSGGSVDVPTGCSIFPKEIVRISRRWAETRFTDIRYWNELDKGGHFAAFEQPEAYVDEVRSFFRLVRRDTVAVPLDDNLAVYDDVGQLMILLNTSAAAVWQLCDGTRTLDEVVRALAEAHGASAADAEVIGEDVRLTVDKLVELGLVVDAET